MARRERLYDQLLRAGQVKEGERIMKERICRGEPDPRVTGSARGRGRKLLAPTVFLFLVLCISVGATLAFITADAGAITNTFVPAQAACEVTEVFDGTVKSDVAVKNTGETDAYIRAAVNITWRKNGDAADQTVSARAPQSGVDYEIVYAVGTGWIKGADGYWYYQTPVAPDASTAVLIGECRQLEDANVPQGYCLSVEIAASAIQSSPSEAVSDKWNVTLEGEKIVSANGKEVSGE